MKYLLAGASGFLGTALRVRLAREQHEVVRLVRREPATATEFRWDPAAGEIDDAAFNGVDAVVDLSGAGLFNGLWTTSRREVLLSSRVDTTRTLSEALARRAGLGPLPVLLQAGGIAYYGTEDKAEPATEDSPAGPDFLSQACVVWEAATKPASDAGGRVVLLRTSPVLDRTGAAFVPLKLSTAVGLGAVVGSGQQHMAMITLVDYLGVVQWAAVTPHASGAYNLTIPQPTTNAEFSDVLAAALHRPRFLRVPAPVLRTALGELAEQLVGDIHAVPERLTRDGYVFYDDSVEKVVASALRGA